MQILLRSAAAVLIGTLAFSQTACILAVGAGAGYLVSQEVLPNQVHQAQVKLDVESVWAQAQTTVREMKVGEFSITYYPRRIETTVDQAEVEVIVEAYDLNRTIIKVHAERYLTSNDEIAEKVLNRILDDFGVAR